MGSSQFGIPIHITLKDAGPTDGFLGLIFCWLSPGCEAHTHVFFPGRQKVSILT